MWRRRFDRTLEDVRSAERRQLFVVLPPVLLNGSVARLVFLGLLGTVAALATGLDTTADVVALVALLVVVNRVVEPVGELAAYGAALRISSARLRDVERVLDARPLPQPTAPAPTPSSYTVELREIAFGYEPGTPVLHGVSLTVPEGSMTALVGASGSGKTTVTKLVARFWDPSEGSVRIGGTDLRDLRDEQVAALVAPVFQNSYLLPGTLRDNVLLARPEAHPDELQQVADLTRVSEIVARLPDGWDTPVGDGGAALSGGERQRVTIARALMKQAPIVVLDEAMSALDAENQAAVSATLDALRGRSTLIVVAHQLSTVTSADQIAVLDAGRVVELGTHDQLRAASGRYAAYWETLSRADGWRLTG
jgi:ATP-binding cassette subfamily B protein